MSQCPKLLVWNCWRQERFPKSRRNPSLDPGVLGRRSQGVLVSGKNLNLLYMVCGCTETPPLPPSFSCPAPSQSTHRPQGCVLQMTAQIFTFPHCTKSPACSARSLHINLPLSGHQQAFWPAQHFGKEPKLQSREREQQEMDNFPLSRKGRQWSESSSWCKGRVCQGICNLDPFRILSHEIMTDRVRFIFVYC